MKEVVINVKLEDAGVVENLNKIETELAALNKERDALLNSNLSTDALTEALNSVDGEINKLNGTYKKITQSTNSYKQAQEAQAQSQQKIIDSQKRLENSIRVSEGVTKTLAGSVNLVTSALATFGVKNEEVAQTLLKLQAAASFATGIKDLVEGYRALAGSLNIAKVAQAAYNAVVAANPYVLAAAAIAALVVGLVAYSSQVDDTKTSQEKFDDEIERSNRLLTQNARQLENVRQALKQNEQALQNEIDLLKAQGASAEVVANKQEQLLKLRGKNATELVDLTKKQLADLTDLDTSFTDKQIANRFKQKTQEKAALISDAKEKKKFIEEEEKKLNDLFTQLGDARAAKDQAYADLQIFQAQRVTDANKAAQDKRKKKDEETAKTLEDNEKARAKLRADTTAEIIKNLDAQAKAIAENNNKELDILKLQLINGDILEETFAAEKLQLEKKTNDEIIKLRENFQLTELQQFIIGSDNEKDIRKKNSEEVIKLIRQNDDIELGIIKSNNQVKIKTTAEDEKARIETFEREYLRKKIDLLNNELLNEEELADALKELEIQKSKERLNTLIVGSSEFLALKAQIIEQELALDKKKADEQKKLTLENIKNLVGDISNIVQDVSKNFESVGQTSLQTLENIANKVPDLFAKFQDETLSSTEKIAAGLAFVGASIGQINTIIQDASEERIAAIDSEEEARIAALQRQKDAGIITEEQLASGTQRIQEQYAKKRRAAEKKAFIQEKGVRIAQAVAQTASAVLAAYSSGVATPIIGPATGAIYAGIAAAFGAAQIALIASQKFPESGGGGGSSTPTPSIPSSGAQQPTSFAPTTFGSGISQQQTFGAQQGTGGGVLRAYVSETDLVDTQRRLRNIRRAGEL